jgi:plastocyanin
LSRARDLLLWAGLCVSAAAGLRLPAQSTVIAHLPGPAKGHAPGAAVLWLQPLNAAAGLAPAAAGPFRLEQKDRAFQPHVLVVPVGATVSFPNDDPFFHNVFSLYNGKRFDLGLYESGTTRHVLFNREGVSYIFCNIHPEMSAVVIALATPWWGRPDGTGVLRIRGVPAGRYEAHLWLEGAEPAQLQRWTRTVAVAGATLDLGVLPAVPAPLPAPHLNKFGKPYKPDPALY